MSIYEWRWVSILPSLDGARLDREALARLPKDHFGRFCWICWCLVQHVSYRFVLE